MHASSWADGNFTHRVQDRSVDEIGRLAIDLNLMAGQLEELIDTKSVLADVQSRQKLALDKHDTAKQQLFAASMQLSAFESLIDKSPAAARKHLDNATDLTKKAQQELYGVIHQLHPLKVADELESSKQRALRLHHK